MASTCKENELRRGGWVTGCKTTNSEVPACGFFLFINLLYIKETNVSCERREMSIGHSAPSKVLVLKKKEYIDGIVSKRGPAYLIDFVLIL